MALETFQQKQTMITTQDFFYLGVGLMGFSIAAYMLAMSIEWIRDIIRGNK